VSIRQAKVGACDKQKVTEAETTAVVHVHSSGRRVLIGDEEVLRRDYLSRRRWVSAPAPSFSGGMKMGDPRGKAKKLVLNRLSNPKRSGSDANDPPQLQPGLVKVRPSVRLFLVSHGALCFEST